MKSFYYFLWIKQLWIRFASENWYFFVDMLLRQVFFSQNTTNFNWSSWSKLRYFEPSLKLRWCCPWLLCLIDSVVKIYLDHKLRWPQDGLNWISCIRSSYLTYKTIRENHVPTFYLRFRLHFHMGNGWEKFS